MHKHQVVVTWSDEDDLFVAEAPELPGCMAHGDTREEALASITEAMDLWVETAQELGRSVPTPVAIRFSPT